MDLRERLVSERRHPWETARIAHVAALLRDSHVGGFTRVLDAGSGDSFLAASLLAEFPDLKITCWDINYSVEDVSEAPAGVERTFERPKGAFDLILALDVIEHVPHDVEFLDDLRTMAEPTATLILTVPAYQALFSKHDVYLGHYRRYSRRGLHRVLAASGWGPTRVGGFFSSLLLVRSLSVLVANSWRKLASPDVSGVGGSVREPRHLGNWDGGQRLSGFLRRCLEADASIGRSAARRLSNGIPGLSVFALASPSAERREVR